MKRALLAASLAMAVASTAVLISRLPSEQHRLPPVADPLAAFNDALHRHDYRRAYALTDLPLIDVKGGSSALTLAHFAAFARAHAFGKPTLEEGLVHIPTTSLHVTALTGPLPSLAIDGVGVRLLVQRVKAGRVAAAIWRYSYAIVVISGPHTLTVGPGPVTAARSVTATFRGNAASLAVSLGTSSRGNKSAVRALDAITMGCPGTSCLVAPCSGHGPEYVLDAWGIGTPPIVARSLVGDRVVAPMPPNGWSIAITFLDQGQPPGISGKEQTKQIRARYVFGFTGTSRGQVLDKCWVSVG